MVVMKMLAKNSGMPSRELQLGVPHSKLTPELTAFKEDLSLIGLMFCRTRPPGII